jgi:hypothetical protein
VISTRRRLHGTSSPRSREDRLTASVRKDRRGLVLAMDDESRRLRGRRVRPIRLEFLSVFGYPIRLNRRRRMIFMMFLSRKLKG